jgi:hypothetical protein
MSFVLPYTLGEGCLQIQAVVALVVFEQQKFELPFQVWVSVTVLFGACSVISSKAHTLL